MLLHPTKTIRVQEALNQAQESIHLQVAPAPVQEATHRHLAVTLLGAFCLLLVEIRQEAMLLHLVPMGPLEAHLKVVLLALAHQEAADQDQSIRPTEAELLAKETPQSQEATLLAREQVLVAMDPQPMLREAVSLRVLVLVQVMRTEADRVLARYHPTVQDLAEVALVEVQAARMGAHRVMDRARRAPLDKEVLVDKIQVPIKQDPALHSHSWREVFLLWPLQVAMELSSARQHSALEGHL